MKSDVEVAKTVMPIQLHHGWDMFTQYEQQVRITGVRAGREAVLREVVERNVGCSSKHNICLADDYRDRCDFCWATAQLEQLGGEDG